MSLCLSLSQHTAGWRAVLIQTERPMRSGEDCEEKIILIFKKQTTRKHFTCAFNRNMFPGCGDNEYAVRFVC